MVVHVHAPLSVSIPPIPAKNLTVLFLQTLGLQRFFFQTVRLALSRS